MLSWSTTKEVFMLEREFNRYLQRGFSVIPLVGKVPILRDWSKYCTESIDFEWRFPNATGIGICTGKESGVVCVDIDTDDKETLDKVPWSPVSRRGQKGEVRFFRYREGIESRNYHAISIEVLSNGRQAVVPPSIHPVTKRPYVWIGESILNELVELPELDLSFLNSFDMKAVVSERGEGRNNKLKEIAVSMRLRGENDITIGNELYNYDLAYHTPRLFTDQDEQFRAKNEDEARISAFKLVNSITKSLLNNKELSQQLLFFTNDEASKKEVKQVIKQFEYKDYPRPEGLMGTFIDLVQSYSPYDCYEMALGSAIGFMGALLSNRVSYRNTYTNTYILNIAKTGSGKGFPSALIGELMKLNKELFLLMGMSGYQSSVAITSNLVSKRVRLDVIDEISDLFRKVGSGDVWQSTISETLCDLWTKSRGHYIAPGVAASSKKEDTTTCHNPCVSIIGSSTERNLDNCLSSSSFSSGLMPRFIFFKRVDRPFCESDFKIENNFEFDQVLLDDISISIKQILDIPFNKISGAEINQEYYNPIKLSETPEVKRYIQALYLTIERKKSALDESVQLDMLTRFIENMFKLSALHCLSRSSQNRVIEMKDVEWADKILSTSNHNTGLFFEKFNAQNDTAKHKNDIVRIVTLLGEVPKKDLIKHTSYLKKANRECLISDLIDSKVIAMKISENGDVIYFKI